MLIETSLYPDERGFFAELFHAEAFRDGGFRSPSSRTIFPTPTAMYSAAYTTNWNLTPRANSFPSLPGKYSTVPSISEPAPPLSENGLDSISKRVMADSFIFLLALLTDSVS